MSFINKLVLLILFLSIKTLPVPIIMLDPAGDAVHKGRTIDGTFERGITLRLAERIKKTLEFSDPQIKVIISRTPGEAIEPLQNAQIAHRVRAKLFIHLACFQETGIKPTLSLYYTLWNPVTDFWQEPSEYAFITLHDAYKRSLKTTASLAILMNQLFSSYNQFQAKGVVGIPLAPLIGIQIPSVLIELGLRNQHDWQAFVEPISSAIVQVMHS